MACRIPAKKSCSSHLFGVVPSRAAQTAFVPELLKAINFLSYVLSGEIAHSNSANRELSNDLSDVVVRRKKVALRTSSHLTPTETWRSPDSTTLEGGRVSSEVRLGNCTQVWGWAKFKERGTHVCGKIVLHTCSDLSKPVRTCPNLSKPVHNTMTMYARLTISFFALSNALILQS